LTASLLEHGVVDLVVHRAKLRETLARVIGLLRRKDPPAEIVPLLPGGGTGTAEAAAS
jgi:acetyl-CoA carboxylase carboxyl transferase subunit beta